MGGRVVQGFFQGGRPRPLPAPAAPVQRQLATAAQPARAGPPPPAFAARTGTAQRSGGSGGDFAIDPVQLGLARGGGAPLPKPLLAKMEAAFGADFSSVRVHIGPQAARIGAIAFTTGNDLYFAPGRYQPESAQGQQLIGHELAHVIQQRQGRVRTPGSGVSVVHDHALEAEADRLGMRAAMHPAVPVAPRAVQPKVQPSPLATPIQPAMEYILGTIAVAAAIGLGTWMCSGGGRRRSEPWVGYSDFDRDGGSQQFDTPWGPVSTRYSRGAPYVQSTPGAYGGAVMGDRYSDFIPGLRASGLTDGAIAQALLDEDPTAFDGVSKRAAAMLYATVNLAEQWRKKGAAKIFRGFLGAVVAGDFTLNQMITQFKFVESADAGREQVGAFYDNLRGEGAAPLSGHQATLFRSQSNVRPEDYSSDEEDRARKALKKNRLHAKKHNPS